VKRGLASPESINTVLARALRILAARPRSEKQLRDRLQSVAGQPQIDHCITRLKEMGLIDDRRFAEAYATHRMSVKPMGRRRLTRELAEKQGDREAISAALKSVFDGTEEEGLIDRAIESGIVKRVRTRGRPSDRREWKSLFDHLMRLGFSQDLVFKKMRAIGNVDVDN
jgi:regulatory protein